VSLVRPEQKLEHEFVHYKPVSRLEGPQFHLQEVIGADDYPFIKAEAAYAINEC
jgi:hypothetical protein